MRALRFVVILAAVTAACTADVPAGTEGSGNLIGDVREVDAFDRLSVDDGISVILEIDPASADPTVVVHYDENLLASVITTVADGTLTLSIDGSIRVPGGGRFVSVRVSSLASMSLAGGASVVGEGAADVLIVEASGGASLDLHAVAAATLQLDVSGGASARVFASESATIVASGGSAVLLYGSPADLAIDESGGATVSVVPGAPEDPAA